MRLTDSIIKSMSYYNQISKYPLLSKEEEKELFKLAAAGSKTAQDKIILSNLRFVITIAAKYKNQGLSFEDLVAEGNAGLVYAAQKFDYSKNVKFITYAAFWIRDSIQKSLFANGKSVRIPSHRSDLFYSQQYAASSLDASLGDSLGESRGTATYEDFLVDPVSSAFTDKICEQDQADKVRQAVSSLPEKESWVITEHFGLNGGEGKSCRQLAKEMQCSHESIRTYENRGLSTLRKIAC